MPELPEVETTLRGVEPWITGKKITDVVIRQRSLRWPVPPEISDSLVGQKISSARRRGKYLLFLLSGGGTLLVHLGMSGSLRIVNRGEDDWRKHDHIGVGLSSGKELRFHDPRRFGCWLYCPAGDVPEECHELLKKLGPEPLSDDFDETYLWKSTRNRKVAIKQFIMNANVVVGVGNIYACEALFLAGISPRKAAGRVTRKKLDLLVRSIKEVLGEAIQMGGTTLRDFLNAEGEAGYFKQELRVYDREGQPCRECGSEIKRIVQSNRSTFYCPKCQK
ncbi:MAG: bifunctional DNA-formamidopyrimidine glycosylase/DNA-(apurinic or apyrimidinic site) lyase [Verrucomicrobiales bacterium]|nr:bifunctional DNA-formamidopyrimidine glycosylase/DNA-(apurinic or apyrimidinic site) lyase [Verrucomicrobiales bacterium]